MNNKSKKLWGSRFEGGTDSLADKFSYSISYDYRLAKYDVIGGIAHAKMLGKCKIINKKDADQIIEGLKQIGEKIEEGSFEFDAQAEDIHTNIQTELKKIIGDAADKLHTGRSRNDLVVLDMKMYCMEHIGIIVEKITSLQNSIVAFAEEHVDVIIPAYTHLQAAQVVLLSHHMLAFVEMLERDKSRLKDTFLRTDSMPLGSCALSGTSLLTDRKYITKELGFIKTSHNSIDSVSDRDFIIELVSDLAILGVHYSRMAEDLIIWATSEFDFIDIHGSLCTGSSIMPHKKNPDILELIRGETGKLSGNLSELITLVKGLPHTYNRDLQLDKPPLFESVEKICDMTDLLSKLFATLNVKRDRLSKRIEDEYFFTVDIMDYLIKKGVSYREAHDTVGRIAKDCLDEGKTIRQLTKEELKNFHKLLDVDVKKLLKAKVSVKIKKSFGSTNPTLVKRQVRRWKNKLRVPC